MFARIHRSFGRVGERGPADGPPLMVVPGFLATDRTTLGLQRALAKAGWRVTGWGMGLNRGVRLDTLDRLAAAIERRHTALAHTAGLNAEVFDALLLLAAGSWDPGRLRAGHAAVVELQRDMDDGRRQRLARLGFAPDQAAALSALHTRNFM